jgi:hypothetical protein
MARACPLFCLSETQTAGNMEAHILYHLETIDLLALPRATGLENDPQNDGFGSADMNVGTDSRFKDSDLSAWSQGEKELRGDIPRVIQE